MAGTGPITTDRSALLRRAAVRRVIAAPKNELEIFYSLCVGRVYFRVETRTLYFVDSPALSITEIIDQVFQGLGETPQIRQLYMDVHGLLRAAMCIQLTALQRQALFAAFALTGIHIFDSTTRKPGGSQ
jgi:hypothetical protein